MTLVRVPTAGAAIAAVLAVAAHGDPPATPLEAARAAAAAATLAAVDVAEDGLTFAVQRLDAVKSVVFAAPATTGRERRAMSRLMRRLDAATVLVGCEHECASYESMIRALRRASSAALESVRTLRTDADGFDLAVRRDRGGFHAPGTRVTFRLVGCDETPVVTLENASESSAQRTFVPGVETLADGRFRVTLGPDLGGVRVTVTACGATRERFLFDEGPDGAFDVGPPYLATYSNSYATLRAGVAATLVSPADSSIDAFEVTPSLPDGLSIDAATGDIAGTPTGASTRASYTVIGRNPRGSAKSVVSIAVAPALPADVDWLEDGFAIEAVAQGLDVPVKMAFAPDGRLFFNELVTGNVRVIGTDGVLVATPFATLPLLLGGERGLLGLALAPDFATSGHVFVYATTPALGQLPDRSSVVRFTAVGDVGTAATTVIDSLPVADQQNGGDLAFGPDGKLYVSVGDTTDPNLSQTDGSRAGRILRFNPDGSVPADNPILGDPEWCRGLRNPFGLAFHEATGSLFASENGPTAHDELEFVQPGKNYEWGAEPETIPGPRIGLRMIDWTPVIVPTGITFLARGGFGPEYGTSLFVAGYDRADLRRIALSGPKLADVDGEFPFARWKDEGLAQKPLDVAEGPDGSLYVSTFTAIWRISRY